MNITNKMSTSQIYLRKNMLGKVRPAYEQIRIKHIIQEKINLRPPYQRDIKWSNETMNGLIDTIMTNSIMPGIIVYKLPEKEISDLYDQECIDGQHRLFVIIHYKNSEKVVLGGKKKSFMIYWSYINHENKEIAVFYKESKDTKEWSKETGREPYYLSSLDQQEFDNFYLDVRTLTQPMNIQERRDMFCSLQNGKAVVNSDYLKNKTRNNPLIEFFSENNYEILMKEYLIPHCIRQTENYWVQWASRFYLLFSNITNGKNQIEYEFVKTDSLIKKMIKNEDNDLSITNEDKILFHQSMNRYKEFLQLQELLAIKFNPTQFFALYTHLVDTNDKNREEILKSNMGFWVNGGKEYKKMWEASSHKQPERRDYFNQCLSELNNFQTPAQEPIKKKISKKMRNNVWVQTFSENITGTCKCGVNIHKDTFVCGHIQSYATGGLTKLKNLRAICEECNRAMGIQNMDIYYSDNYYGNSIC